MGSTRDEKAKVRQIFNEVFRKNRPAIVAALAKCFTSPETVLESVELLARLEGGAPVKARKAAGPATRSATGNSGENSGMGNLRPFKPGQSGNLAGRPRGDARIRRLLNESLTLSEQEALAAFRRRWASTRYCQDMAELLAKLEGEMTKEGDTGAGRIQVIVLNNQGARPLDPDVFREAVEQRAREDRARRALEMRQSHPGPSPGFDPT